LLTSNSIRNDSEIGLNAEQLLTIGQIAEMVSQQTGKRCTVAMINNYERHGLVSPPKRSTGGFRLYPQEIIRRVVIIKHLQEEKLSLEEIKVSLDQGLIDFKDYDYTSDLPFDRRRMILEAAARVFPKKGYVNTKLQTIAEEAGISISTIYQYFPSKEELFLALTDNLSFQEVLDHFNNTINFDEIDIQDVRQALIEIATSFIETHTHYTEVVRLYISEGGTFPEIGEKYCQRLILPLEALLENFISKNIERGYFRKIDLHIAVRGFYGMFSNIFLVKELLYGKNVLDFPTEKSIEGMVDLYLSGIAGNMT